MDDYIIEQIKKSNFKEHELEKIARECKYLRNRMLNTEKCKIIDRIVNFLYTTNLSYLNGVFYEFFVSDIYPREYSIELTKNMPYGISKRILNFIQNWECREVTEFDEKFHNRQEITYWLMFRNKTNGDLYDFIYTNKYSITRDNSEKETLTYKQSEYEIIKNSDTSFKSNKDFGNYLGWEEWEIKQFSQILNYLFLYYEFNSDWTTKSGHKWYKIDFN